MKDNSTYEENVKRLEEIVLRLERGDISLEEGLASFEEGIALVKVCQKQLDRVSEKLQMLTREGRIEEVADNAKGE